jgi:putative ABC transport system substrate-binding protein
MATIARRELLAALAVAAAWPIAALAQTALDRTRRVGVLMVVTKNAEGESRLATFRQSLKELGWSEDRNLLIQDRWAAGDPILTNSYAAELVAAKPDAILANATASVAALRKYTSSVPIVFVQVADPVGVGFIPTLSHPGGNITGFTHYEFTLAGKWLELLKEIDPRLIHVGVVDDRDDAATAGYLAKIRSAAPALGVQITAMQARNGDDIERGVNTLAAERNSGLLVLPSALTAAQRDLIVALAGQHKLPAVYPYRYFIPGGGLLSYGIEVNDLYRQAAGYINRILRGEKPGDLPVQAPTKFQMVINLKAAKALGLEVPVQLQQLADEVIE